MITQQILRAVNESGREKTIGVIFDKDNKAREGRFSELCDRYISQYYLGDMFTGYGFADSRQLTALQAADLLAYGTIHLTKSKQYPNEPPPEFPIIPGLMRMLHRFAEAPQTSPIGMTMHRDGLAALVGKVKRGEVLPKKGM